MKAWSGRRGGELPVVHPRSLHQARPCQFTAGPGKSGTRPRADGARGLRRYAPLQIVHGGAADAAREGRLQGFLDRLVALGLGGIAVNHPPAGYLRDPEG